MQQHHHHVLCHISLRGLFYDVTNIRGLDVILLILHVAFIYHSCEIIVHESEARFDALECLKAHVTTVHEDMDINYTGL